MTGSIMLAAGFLVNFISALIIIRGIYYPKQKDHNFIFTFLVFNAVIYIVMSLFTSVELSIGIGFGLFALFSVLRYRTETVPIREMTYLFVMVALPLVNAFFFQAGKYETLLLSNLLIILVTWILEKGIGFSCEGQKQIVYERIDLVHADRREELIADLKSRTGLSIIRVDVLLIDYLRDTADIMVYYTINAGKKENLISEQ
ncbi:DUF4956 domain-containing protein [Methanospirillum stamsii]|uniref:DUF4956 domain-containing protein n=1 Tax=Methanospirillum stamsii TaxID=1277351 RepID=A0A2V2NA38_9EURY|nr:DUF4956 domain-containing protein [Methanospirillum stamsii]PWR72491.1 DUF4956 domain-containing protein [Methanospirillum stamsii]